LCLVLGTLRASALLGFRSDLERRILDLVLGTLRATTLLRLSRGLLEGILGLVLGTLRATALLWFSRDLLEGILGLVLGTLRATPLLRGVVFERGDKILDLDLKRIRTAVHGDGVGGDVCDKVSDTLGDINDVGHFRECFESGLKEF